MKLKKIISAALSLCIAGAFAGSEVSAIGNTDTVISIGTVNEFSYEIRSDENGERYAVIADFPDTYEGEVVIPSYIEEVPVKIIGPGAFNYCEGITSVTFPDTIETIGWGAFYQAHFLGTVHIPSSVRTIELNAFYECYIPEITIDYGLQSVGGLDYNSFTEVELPASVSYVYDAFYACGALEKLKVLNPDCEFNMGSWSLYSDVVIYGYEGSTAQALAQELGNQFVSLGDFYADWLGDVNFDGRVTPTDAALALSEYASAATTGVGILTDIEKKTADYNRDGSVTPTDAAQILSFYADNATDI